MKLCLLTTALLFGSLAVPTSAQSRTASHPPAASLLRANPHAAATIPARPRAIDPSTGADLEPLAAPTRTGGILPAPLDEGGGHSLGTCACSGSPAENEPGCGVPTDSFNGGCNYMPHVFSSITLGGSVCGTAAFDGTTRDTDWYQFTLTSTTTVVWTVHAEFPSVAILMNGVCPESDISFSLANACQDCVTSATLAPGTYYAVAVPQFASVITCGVSDDYHATLLGVSTCSYDDGATNGGVGLGSFGGGEQMYLHRQGGVGEFAQVSSISMVWGTSGAPGQGPPNNSPAQIRIFKDPDDDGIPDDLILLKTKAFLTAGVDTEVFQTVAFDAPVTVSGVYFIAVSIVSASGVFPLGYDNNTPPANRAWFTAETNGSGGVLDYSNFGNNDFFGENSSLGINGVYLLRGDCQPLEGGCQYDDTIADTESGLGGQGGGEQLYLDVFGSPGEVATVSSVSMSWGSAAITGFSVPNGSGAQIRIFEDPNDDGLPNDAVLLQTQGLLTQDADTNIFHATVFSPPVVVRGVYFVGVSIVSGAGQYPLGYDLSTPAANRSWWIAQPGGVINYGNLSGSAIYGPNPTSVGIDGVHMLRADCHPEDEITPFCAGGVGGIVTCPCGNPQVPAGATRGCNNFAGGGTGGAILAGTGAATISGDSVAMNLSAGVAGNVTVLFQGTTNAANSRTGAGVKCVAGTLKRLYKGNQSAGAIAFPNNATPFHLQSLAKGFTITPPVTLYYYAAYRNSAANGQPGCPGLTFGFNSTNALAVIWTP